MPIDGGVAARLSSRRVLPAALGLSIAAWLPATLLVTLAAAGLDVHVGILEGMRIFGAATVGGGVSLMPAGMGATGSLAILQLDRLGVGLAAAVVIVSIVRLATAGITLAVGGVFLLVEVRALRAKSADVHFDDIADEYIDQFAPHIWDLLLERKTTLIASALPPAADAGTGLDLGCGLGRQCRALHERGFRVWGIDAAHNLVRQASATGVTALTGSALELPFEDGSLDFVYTVGVLHHLPGPGAQATAYAEVARVLKPGGAFIIHETNPRNPLFRLYMGYVFPMLRSIDEGIEHWIDPVHLNGIDGLDRVRVEYFTFLPDFLPRPLLRIALGLERRLERSRMRRYSVHYMAVLRKDEPDDGEPTRRTGALDAARA
jgi:SAM-dependent methyltransferase